MDKEQEIDYYKKFPAILRAKLIEGEIVFPRETQFNYEPVLAYRGVIRDKNDNTPLNNNDMKSYFELGKQPKGVTDCASDPKFYAVSLFKSLDMLKQCLKFPRPNKKVAQGYVYMEGGPQYSEGKSHVNWWLYEDVSFDNFVIKEDKVETL